MAALLPDYEYDIFISYRQNDNKYDGWVTTFVENLQKELEATIKANISVYFDENPHDGLLDTHQVDKSLSAKLKCLIFIPVISQTYCDPNSFAWQREFMVFNEMASEDRLGMLITLPNGNVCSRVLPIKIHTIDEADQKLLEDELDGGLRSIDFIHMAPGINRPLDSKRDDQYRDNNQIIYRDQINKVANSIKEILVGIKNWEENKHKLDKDLPPDKAVARDRKKFSFELLIKSVRRRNIPQVILVYTAFSIIIQRILTTLIADGIVSATVMPIAIGVLILGGIVAISLAWNYEFGPEGLMRTSSWESKLNPYPSYKRKPFTGLATISALVLIIVIQVFYFNYFPNFLNRENPGVKTITISVLPFIDDSKNIRDGNYFSKDLTGHISNQLSKIHSLHVRPTNYNLRHMSDSLNYRLIGEELDVETVLTGRVRRFGNQLLILPQLIEIESNKVIWGDAFSRDMQDLYVIQNEIAILIARELEIELSINEVQNIEIVPTKNISAYDHYLLGREHYTKYSRIANDSAVMEFKAAIAVDSTFAYAWSGLGDAYSQRNSMFGQEIDWNDSSIKAASRAVELDPSLAEAYKALGNAYNYKLQYEIALEYFFKALEINPNYGAAIGNIGSTYNSLGKLDESIKWQLKSAALNPNSFIPPLMLGWTYRELGNYDKAEDWLKISLKTQPFADTYRELGFNYVLQGNETQAIYLLQKVIELGSEEARNHEQAGLIALFANELDSAKNYFEWAVELNPNLLEDPNSIIPLAKAYFMLGSEQDLDAIAELERLKNRYLNLINKGSQDDDHRIYLAGISIMQGNENESLQWIRMAIDANWQDIAEIDHLPWFSQLRSNPEYKEITAEQNASIRSMRTNADRFE